ncbi:MAG TPA: discoidin domain-containing protein [Gemmataceae bacterium]|nr:discoidin domain-containing protein [Gemmataceae bacterium]
MKLYFLDDGKQVTPPSRFDLEYWDGKTWTLVPKQIRSPKEPTGRRAHVIRLPELQTSKVRAVFRHGTTGRTGLTEFEVWGDAALPVASAPPPAGNLALNKGGQAFPKASASFTSRFDKVEFAIDGVVNFNPTPHNRWTCFESPNESDWLEIDFGAPKKVARIELAIYDDRGAVQAPKQYNVQYWNGAKWQDARAQKKLPLEPVGSQLNEVRFQEVSTSKVRVVFSHNRKARSGLSEIFIWSE